MQKRKKHVKAQEFLKRSLEGASFKAAKAEKSGELFQFKIVRKKPSQ